MTVQDLRETLTQLVRLLEAADAKKGTVTGLNEFIEATSGFGDLNLKAFVKLAEVGRTPPAPRPPAPRRGGAKVDPAAVMAEVRALYERAAEPNVTEEQVRAACDRLGGLTKGKLVELADSIGLVGMNAKKKDEIVAGITNRVVDRKGAAIRRQLIDRPVSADGVDEPVVMG